MRVSENVLLIITYLANLSIPLFLTPWAMSNCPYNEYKSIGTLLIPIAFSIQTVLLVNKMKKAGKPIEKTYITALAISLALNYLIFWILSYGQFSGPVFYSNI
jgi:hypothetical protein